MIVRRRFPNFFSGFEDDITEHEVNSYEELMEIPWLKDKKDINGHIGIFFSPDNPDHPGTSDRPDYLMTLSKGKTETIYFVIGYIFGDGKKLGLTNYLDYIKEHG